MDKMIQTIFENLHGFQWDDANISKNWQKHQVSSTECEEIFFNQPILLFDDLKHSDAESRFFVLGKTNTDRKLFAVFTVRKNLIRIVSARDMSKKERGIYEQA